MIYGLTSNLKITYLFKRLVDSITFALDDDMLNFVFNELTLYNLKNTDFRVDRKNINNGFVARKQNKKHILCRSFFLRKFDDQILNSFDEKVYGLKWWKCWSRWLKLLCQWGGLTSEKIENHIGLNERNIFLVKNPKKNLKFR